eukprot:gene5098-216_t
MGDGPIAMKRKLGYVLSGPVDTPPSYANDHRFSTHLTESHILKAECLVVNSDSEVNEQIHKFWDYESIGVKSESPAFCDNYMENEIEFNGRRYEAKLPFKPEHEPISDNFLLCKNRLHSVLKRLSNKPTILNEYDKVIHDQLKEGVVEIVDKTLDIEQNYEPGHHIMTEGKNDPLFVYNTLRSLYVDDYQSSFSTNNEAFETYRKLKDSLHKVGFNMRKWVTNNKELKERIKKHEALYTPVSENANVLEDPNHEQPDTKVLGIGWNLITDSLKLDFEKIVRDTSITMVTKRSILCTTAKFYDPLGLISPVILPLKCLFQELCKIKENWDSPVHDKIAQKFRDIILDIRSVSKIELPRSVMHEVEVSDIKSVQLHGFSDASTVAYAASVYLRVETSSRVVSHLIASKTRVSPLKSESVPRLELMGALILARLMKTTAFVVDEVSNVIKESIEGAIGGNAYQHNKVNQWTSSVVEQCLNQLTKLGKPFKYIGKKCSLMSQPCYCT